MKTLDQFYNESVRIPTRVGTIMDIMFAWRGQRYSVKMFFPQIKLPSRKEIQIQLNKVYPGSKVFSYDVTEYDSGDPLFYASR